MAINPATLQMIGTGLSVVSSLGAGKARQSDAQFNRYQYELDAQQREIEGQQRANQRIREYDLANSQNIAMFAFMNRDPADRSIRAFMEAQKSIAYEDASVLKTQAMLTSAQSKAKAGMEQRKGQAALTEGYLGAASSIVSGFYRYEQVKVG